MVIIDGGRNSDNVESCITQFCLICRELDLGCLDDLIADLLGRIYAFFVQVNLRLVQVESDDLYLLCKCHCNWHSNVAQTNQ